MNRKLQFYVVGWDKCSYGYHGDDGNSFCSSDNAQPYGPTFTTGDVVGCCLNLVDNVCFYTKNGINLGDFCGGSFAFLTITYSNHKRSFKVICETSQDAQYLENCNLGNHKLLLRNSKIIRRLSDSTVGRAL